MESLPIEILEKVLEDFTYTEIQKNIRPINHHFFAMFGNSFHGLPPVLWGKVFEHLGQEDLLTVERTCTQFRGMIQKTRSPVIRATLFREHLVVGSQPPLMDPQDINVHPLFRMLDFSLRGSYGRAEDCVDVHLAGGRKNTLRYFPASRDAATSPPYESLTVGLPQFKKTITINKKRLLREELAYQRKAEKPCFAYMWPKDVRKRKAEERRENNKRKAEEPEESLDPKRRKCGDSGPSVALTVMDVVGRGPGVVR
ncbi:hypothetical protein TWF281_004857 [Arthrobotrys megalospora]